MTIRVGMVLGHPLDEGAAVIVPTARRRRIARLLVPVLAMTLVLAACGSTPTAPPSGAAGSATEGPPASPSPTGPAPLVIDSDLGADDFMAIAFLTTQTDYEIKAITVARCS